MLHSNVRFSDVRQQLMSPDESSKEHCHWRQTRMSIGMSRILPDTARKVEQNHPDPERYSHEEGRIVTGPVGDAV